MGGINRVIRFLGGSHYHQQPHKQPGARPMQVGIEKIEVFTGGQGSIEIDGEWIALQPGDLLWHVAGDMTISRSVPEDPYRCLTVSFEVYPDLPRPVPRLTRWNDLDELATFTREIVRGVADNRFDRDVLGNYVYGRLRYQATRAVHRAQYGTLPKQLAVALERIDRDYREPLVVEDLADAVGWSVTHLHAVFKHELDTSPHQALIQRRLRAARELLAASDFAVATVAEMVGFPNPAHFSRSFRQTVGMSPGQYRKHYADPVAQ
ncbi:MAG: AraC family transcriptional regulator [Planctomycetota bacterium]|jgi:AraC-like DNA-binding protein|nr:AraC family transcriptional regulator [Planctomycetota bacterium]